MPIYEYHCKKCDKVFESLVMGDETPKCPECDTEDVVRIMSACGFVSKGAQPSGGGEAPTTASSAGSNPCSGCTSGNCSSCGL